MQGFSNAELPAINDSQLHASPSAADKLPRGRRFEACTRPMHLVTREPGRIAAGRLRIQAQTQAHLTVPKPAPFARRARRNVIFSRARDR